VPDLLVRQVYVVHNAIVGHDRKSFVFVIEGNRLQLIVNLDLCHAEVVVEVLENSFQEPKTKTVKNLPGLTLASCSRPSS